MNNRYKKWNIVFLLLIVLTLCSINIHSEPEGGEISRENSTRHVPNAAQSIQAVAGNISLITINVNTSTQTWAAYYGNVTGTLLLSNGADESIYKWDLADPRGEIFFANESISFDNIECWNDTVRDGTDYFTLEEFEKSLGLTNASEDGVNETFSEILKGTHDGFYVGTTYIEEDSCPSMNLYNSSGEKNPDQFQEVLLYEPTQEAIIYTAILEQNGPGFDGSEIDFQIIVGDNGHANSDSTPYYVYLELE